MQVGVLSEAHFTITQFVTKGKAKSVVDPAPTNVCIFPQRIDFSQFAKFYRSGVRVVIPRTRSYSTESLGPKVKHYSRMNFVIANLEAADVDPEVYPILLDENGIIAEHTAGNFYLITDGVLRMPTDHSTLQGYTQRAMRKIAKRLGIPAVEEDLRPYHAYTADEIFLTNTIYRILPAGKIDNRPVGDDVPGQITRQLQFAWSEMVGVDFVGQVLTAANAWQLSQHSVIDQTNPPQCSYRLGL